MSILTYNSAFGFFAVVVVVVWVFFIFQFIASSCSVFLTQPLRGFSQLATQADYPLNVEAQNQIFFPSKHWNSSHLLLFSFPANNVLKDFIY